MNHYPEDEPDFVESFKVVCGKTGREYEPGEHRELQRRKAETRLRGRFIKGPMPVAWMRKAFLLKPSAAKAAVALFYLRGLRQSDTFQIEPARFRELGIDDTARRRGLRDLEEAGLISVQQMSGRAPVITMMGVDRMNTGGG